MKLSIVRLRIWNSQTAVTQTRWLLKNKYYLGSDKKCGVRLQGLSGLVARLKFDKGEWEVLGSGQPIAWPEKQVQMAEPYALLYQRFSLLNRPVMVAAACLVILLCLTGFLTVGESEWICEYQKSGRPQSAAIKRLEKPLKDALKSADLVKARAESLDFYAELEKDNSLSFCQRRASHQYWEAQFQKAWALQSLEKNDVVRAFSIYQNNEAASWARPLRKKLIAQARELYFEGYQLEEEDSEAGYAMMADARFICQALDLDERCQKPAPERSRKRAR
jgi:hypothetical protein